MFPDWLMPEAGFQFWNRDALVIVLGYGDFLNCVTNAIDPAELVGAMRCGNQWAWVNLSNFRSEWQHSAPLASPRCKVCRCVDCLSVGGCDVCGPITWSKAMTANAPTDGTGTGEVVTLTEWTEIAGDWYRRAPADNADGRRAVAHVAIVGFGYRVHGADGNVIERDSALTTLQAARDAADAWIREHGAAHGIALPTTRGDNGR